MCPRIDVDYYPQNSTGWAEKKVGYNIKTVSVQKQMSILPH